MTLSYMSPCHHLTITANSPHSSHVLELFMSDSVRTDNGMVFNPPKSDAILFGTSQRLKTSVDIAGSVIQLSDTIKILGVTLDSSVTMGTTKKALFKSCFTTYDLLKNLFLYGLSHGRLRCFCFDIITT